MSNTIRFTPSLKSLAPRSKTTDPLRPFTIKCQSLSNSTLPLPLKSQLFPREVCLIRGKTTACSAEEIKGAVQELDDDSPVSVELHQICNEAQFDSAIEEAQKNGEPVIFIWMANWCRQCIYLKPKLEKLAAEYYPRLRFFCVDVNTIPHKLVVRAGVTKMPTIQLWRDMEKQTELIGGHKAYLVVNEVREMIENDDNS